MSGRTMSPPPSRRRRRGRAPRPEPAAVRGRRGPRVLVSIGSTRLTPISRLRPLSGRSPEECRLRVAFPAGGEVVLFAPGEPHRVPSRRGHLGCRMVAAVGPGARSSGGKSCKSLVGARGFEPRTSSLSGRLIGLPRWTQGSTASHTQSQQVWPFAAKIWGRSPKASQRSQSWTGHLGCRMLAAGPPELGIQRTGADHGGERWDPE